MKKFGAGGRSGRFSGWRTAILRIMRIVRTDPGRVGERRELANAPAAQFHFHCRCPLRRTRRNSPHSALLPGGKTDGRVPRPVRRGTRSTPAGSRPFRVPIAMIDFILNHSLTEMILGPASSDNIVHNVSSGGNISG